MYFSTELNNFYQLIIHCVYNGMFRIGLKTNAFNFFPLKKVLLLGASLVAQRLRICLPMQGTRVRALVWEDPTCCGATRPVSHNY